LREEVSVPTAEWRSRRRVVLVLLEELGVVVVEEEERWARDCAMARPTTPPPITAWVKSA
jgi:hypothetical protein